MLVAVTVMLMLGLALCAQDSYQTFMKRKSIELPARNLTDNLREWETDLAIMFYSPTCQYCKQLAPSWEQIAKLVMSKHDDIVITKFNCEGSGETLEMCKALGVDRYPSVYYLGYGSFNQAPASNPFGKNNFPRMARFTADLYPEAIYDWVRMLAGISKGQRKWDNFTSFFLGRPSRLTKKVQRLQEENAKLSERAELFGNELEKYKAIEIFNEIPDNGDVFPLLHELAPDTQNLPLRLCVADLATEFCKYFKTEQYCIEQLPTCAKSYLVEDDCRPNKCPFEDKRGCNTVSSCLKREVISEYQKYTQTLHKSKTE